MSRVWPHLNLLPQHIQEGVLLLTGEPDIHHRAREQQGRGFHILTRSDRFKPGGSPLGCNPLPKINFIRETRGHKITVRIRRTSKAVAVQVHRFSVNSMEAGGSRAEIELGHLLGSRDSSQGLGLCEPGPSLPQLEILGKDTLHCRVQPRVVKLPPPLTQRSLACRPMMIRLRDGNGRLLKRTHRVRVTAGDDK